MLKLHFQVSSCYTAVRKPWAAWRLTWPLWLRIQEEETIFPLSSRKCHRGHSILVHLWSGTSLSQVGLTGGELDRPTTLGQMIRLRPVAGNSQVYQTIWMVQDGYGLEAGSPKKETLDKQLVVSSNLGVSHCTTEAGTLFIVSYMNDANWSRALYKVSLPYRFAVMIPWYNISKMTSN